MTPAVSRERAAAIAPLGVLLAACLGLGIFGDRGAPFGIVVQGAVLGAATALTAMGLILIWRSHRCINFAFGALGAAFGLTAVQTFLTWNWPYWLALTLGLIGGIATGALTELLVIRRFEKASRLILTIATIGLAQILGGLEIMLPKKVYGVTSVVLGSFTSPLTDIESLNFDIGVVHVSGDYFLIVLIVPLIAFGLGWFFKRSSVGIAMRAASENTDQARLLGINVGRLHLLVWALAGGLSAMTYLLKAPISGAVSVAAAGPTVLLVPLAAAVLARMQSLPIAAIAAMGLGVLEQLIQWNLSAEYLDIFVFAVILIGLLMAKGKRNQRESSESWQIGGAIKKLPDHIRSIPLVRATRITLTAVALGAAVVVPWWFGTSRMHTISTALIWGMVGCSLVVLTGMNGHISLGQFGIVGLGAITVGNMMNRYDLDLFLALMLAIGAGALMGLVLGIPGLRIEGPFLAVTTLSFAAMLNNSVLNPNLFPDLIPETVRRPVLFERWDMEKERTMYWVILAFALLSLIVARAVRNQRTGRNIIATRDHPRGAEALSVASKRTQLIGCMISGAIAGCAGGLDVVFLHGARANSYLPTMSVEATAYTTIGGMTSIWGGFGGSFALRMLQTFGSQEFKLIASGAGLLLVLYLVPTGLVSAFVAVRDRVVGHFAARVGENWGSSAWASDASFAAIPSTAVSSDGVLSVSAVEVKYGNVTVLRDVSMNVQPGEIVALLGTNGAGKSTLLRAIMGLARSRGSIVVKGQELRGMRADQIVRRGIVLMNGGKAVFPTLTVREHLRLATWSDSRTPVEIEQTITSLLGSFPALDRRANDAAGNLSGGEQQQLALAQCLLLNPQVLLIDELSLGLSPTLVGQLMDMVKQLNAQGVTVVVVEQSINVALELAERAVFMEKGQVRFSGATKELTERPDILRAVFLPGAEESDDPAPTKVSVPREPDAEPVLVVEALHQRFGGIVAVDDVTFSVHPGEILGLIGQNGAGKTTILDGISGFNRISGGRIVFRGTDITDWQPWERSRARLARSFQSARLFPSLTLYETLAVACERIADSRSTIADLTRQPASFESELKTKARVDEIIELLGLGDFRWSLTADLSTGTRRVVELGCLLAADPVMLLLDEPSAGVAQREAEQMGPLLKSIRDETGVSMLMIEHDMPLIASTCDTVVALELGRVIASGQPKEVLAHPAVVESYLGSNAAAVNRSGMASATSN